MALYISREEYRITSEATTNRNTYTGENQVEPRHLAWLKTVLADEHGDFVTQNEKDEQGNAIVIPLGEQLYNASANRTALHNEFHSAYLAKYPRVTNAPSADTRVLSGKNGLTPDKGYETNLQRCIPSLRPLDNSPIESSATSETGQSTVDMPAQPFADVVETDHQLQDTPRLQRVDYNGINLLNKTVARGMVLATEGGHNHAGSARDAKFLLRRAERTRKHINSLSCSTTIKNQLWNYHLRLWRDDGYLADKNGKLIDSGRPENDAANLQFTKPLLGCE